jgi:hypothetical protein
VERLARDKRSSLLRKIITYSHKSFITLATGGSIGPWLCFEIFIYLKITKLPITQHTLKLENKKAHNE